ncbi:MAG: alpha-2-macroglobulin, partial [Hyphomicrobiaceae bacterium]
HEAFKRRSYWRPAIEALRVSAGLAPTPERQAALERLVAEHGFRILEYKVDSDAAQPRLCVQFSEALRSGQVDWAQYVLVDGRDPQAVTAESRQLCVDGLAHGKRYEVQVRAGLPSGIRGEALAKTAELAVYVKDRAPSVRAVGRSYVLPNRGQQGIPLVTVNTDNIKIEVYRIGDRSIAQVLQSGDFQRQLASYDLSTLKEKSGARVYAGEMQVPSRLNEDVTTAFPVAEAIPRLAPGVYVLAAHASVKKGDNGGRVATQWFIVSDLGLTAINGDDGVHGFVRSLATARGVANVKVRLIARNNEVLGTAKTDSRGYVRFDSALARGEGGQSPAVLVAETEGGDYAFLDMTAAAFDLTDRGVKGRGDPGPVDAFAYADRGVYRAGETVHLTTLVRTRTGAAAPVPVTLVLWRPDGVEHSRFALTDQGLGGRAAKLALAPSAMTGTWRVKIHTDPKAAPIAQAAFLVEDFVPERLDLKLETTADALSPQQPGRIKVAGRYLYGPAAAGLSVEGEIAVRASTKESSAFPGYRFGVADEQFSPVRKALEGLPATDADGKAEIAVDLPAYTKTNLPLEAMVFVRLRESGGRTIERTVTLPIDPKTARIGIKPLFKGQVGEGETARFEAILVGADGKAVAAKGLKWQVSRLERRWQWYSRDGSWAYEATTTTRRIASGTVDASSDAPARIEAKLDWGRYRLEVSDGSGLVSSVVFNAGYWADDGADTPEALDVALDKPAYKPGDIARVKITSRMAGRALVAVMGSGLLTTQEVDLPAGGGEVPLTVSDKWEPGAYVAVMLYRPIDEKAKRMPGRAVGLRWLAIDQQPRTLSVKFDVPEKVESGSVLTVPVKLAGLTPGEEARVTIAATDLGILNLTRFETPRPDQWFFGQRRLGSEIRDLYGRLIDGMRAERGKLRSGGDGGEVSLQGSPPVEATLALFSGIVQVGPDGAAKAEFQLPDFNGTVRLTAVVWSASKVGSASKDVVVRDPVALTVSAPRFLTLGDEARLELALHNVEGQAGTYKVTGTFEAEPGAQAQAGFERSVAIATGERKREAFTLKPAAVGLTNLSLRITGPGGIDLRRTLSFDVKVPAGDIKRLTVTTLAPKDGKLTVSSALLHDLIPSRSKVTVSAGPHGALDVPGILTALDRYPYGCAEQTVSRALPLLYVNSVARRIGIAGDAELRQRIDAAIARVFEMQDASGAFGVWGPSDGDMWLTAFVTDFLTRARELGYAVRQRPFSQALDRLANYIGYAQDFERGGEDRAYALYVLARNGQAPIGELRYYVDTRLDRFATPLAQAQLGAALAMIGDRPRAERAFQAALLAVA